MVENNSKINNKKIKRRCQEGEYYELGINTRDT
jgi:hypothetical protein